MIRWLSLLFLLLRGHRWMPCELKWNKGLRIIILLLHVRKANSRSLMIGHKALIWSIDWGRCAIIRHKKQCNKAFKTSWLANEMGCTEVNWKLISGDTELHCDLCLLSYLQFAFFSIESLFLILCISKMWLLRPKGCLSAVVKPRHSSGMTMLSLCIGAPPLCHPYALACHPSASLRSRYASYLWAHRAKIDCCKSTLRANVD